MKNPMQPLYIDEHGTKRFKQNDIVDYILDKGSISLNDLAGENFSQDDWEQFYQLMGYSLNGFGELHRVSDDTYEKAEKLSESNVSEIEAENIVLKEKLAETRKIVKNLTTLLFNVHPDDLGE